MKAWIAEEELISAEQAVARGDRAMVRLNPSDQICRQLRKGAPVEVTMDFEVGPAETGGGAEARVEAIVAALPDPERIPDEVPWQVYGGSHLTVFLAAAEAEEEGRDPPGFIPAAARWRWVPDEQRKELARTYVVNVERADSPKDKHGKIPWSTLAGYLGVGST